MDAKDLDNWSVFSAEKLSKVNLFETGALLL